MQGFVSSRQYRGVASVALSGVFVACSILIPFGFPWLGFGLVGLTLGAALWLNMDSRRSLAEVLRAVEGEPLLALAADCGGSPADPTQRR